MNYLFHQPATDFPIALWLTSLLFDFIHWRNGRDLYRSMATWLIGLGIAGAVLALATGYYDYFKLLAAGVGTEFERAHQPHAVAAFAATAAYVASFVVRLRRPKAKGLIVILALAGAVLIGLTGFLGGQLFKTM
ncbi:MAG: DUF2231 domain-containing protein [Armatimonadetes bacterium]|nr:DUF2231 domain-containing protein [Armatimonadota bacterium]